MPKAELKIINDEDGGRTIKVAGATARGEDPVNPLDPTTGEPTFDDINSRFTMDRAVPKGSDAVDADGNIVISDDDLGELFPKTKDLPDEDLDEEDEDEEDEPAAIDSDEEDEEETDEPSPRRRKGWHGRVDRERRLRDEAEADVADLRARLDKMQATIDGQASEAAFAAKKKELGAKIEAARVELKAAVEAGETDRQVDLTEKLSDLKAELRSEERDFDKAKTAREASKTTANTIVARKVDQWKRQHPRYANDPVFSGAANGIDSQLAAEGYNPETPEYYEELDKRLAKRFPEEYKGRRREGRKHPSQNQQRETDGTRRPAKKLGGHFQVDKSGRVRLSKFDVDTMRQFNMDPDNAEDVRAYIRENSR